ncbi:MAG: hypothetical protein IIB03_04365 [Acidobacteria bacterium]|nr:hypothetical protein [Acidobacteriota bacterium]
MTEEHVRFSELDFENTENLAHTDGCEECGKRLSIFRFLGFQVKNVPGMDPSPFFSKRVSQMVWSTKVSFSLSFQQVAKQLIPAFMVLLLATSCLLYFVADTESATEQYSELFFDQPFEEDLSIDDVVGSLAELAEEDSVP